MLSIQEPPYLRNPYQSYHAGAPTAKHVPIHGGLWIRNISENEEGTLGCIVTRGGNPYILTCQHVAIPGDTQPNNLDVVTQPPIEMTGAREVGKVIQTLGPPAGSVLPPTADPFAVKDAPTFTDAALISITKASYSYEIPGVGIPTGVKAPVKGMKVKMLGARTGLHTGTITNADFKVIAKNTQDGNWIIVNHAVAYSMAHDSGDSGSVVLEQGTNKAVCMTEGIVTTSEQKQIFYGTRLDFLAKVMGISFVGKAGTFGAEVPTTPKPGPIDPRPSQPTTDMQPIIIVGGALVAGYIVSRLL